MNFKKITTEEEAAAKAKYLEHGQGVLMSSLVAYENANEKSAKWHDLINTQKYSEQAIVARMKSVARNIATTNDDPLLENSNVIFTHITDVDERIPFTLDDSYLFLRAALQHRRNSAEYKTKKAKIKELTIFIEANKTLKEKRKDASKELDLLEASL